MVSGTDRSGARSAAAAVIGFALARRRPDRRRFLRARAQVEFAAAETKAPGKALAHLRVQQNGKLFTFGFSQGGHAALAVHRELESAGVDVAATATVGGVFDVEQWFLASLANETTPTLPLYVYGLLKQRVPPEINAVSALMIVVSIVLVGLSLGLQRRGETRSNEQ